MHLAGAAAGALAVLDAPGQLARLHVGAPHAAVARAAGHHVVQRAVVSQQLPGAHRPDGGHESVVGRCCGRGGAGRVVAEQAGQRLVPGLGIQPGRVQARHHAAVGQRQLRHGLRPHADDAARHAAGGGIALIRHHQLVGHVDAKARAAAAVQLRAFVAQRPGGVGRLGQRRGQVDDHAAQVAGHQHVGLAGAKADHGLVGRAAAGAPRDGGQRRPVGGVAQAFGSGGAAGAQLHRGRAAGTGLAAAGQARLATQQVHARIVNGETGFAEADRALRLPQQRRVGRDAQVVAGQADTAFHPGILDAVHRQIELEVQARVAVGLGAVQHLLREAGHRRLPHDAQRRRQRAGAFGIHQHARVAQVGNARLHARELPAGVPAHLRLSVLHLHAVVVEDQLARQVLQRRPGHLPGGLQAGRHVGQRDAVHLPGKAEFAARRCLRTGDVAQIALHAHRHVARLALDHRLAHVAARRFGNAQRQVTVHARAVGAAEAARQVQHARKARRPLLAGHGLPFRLEGARGIGVAQLQLVHVQLDLPALHAPAGAGGQLGQRDAWLVEHARKAEGAVADGQRRVAAGRRGLELQRSPFDARNAFHRLAIGPGRRGARTHGHGAGPGLHAPVARRLQRAAPARLDALDQALHRVRLQALVHGGRQR